MPYQPPQGMGPIRPQAQVVQGGPMPMNNMRPVGHMQVRNTEMPPQNIGNNISNQMMQLWRLQQMQHRINQGDQRLGNQMFQGQAQVGKSGAQVDALSDKLMRLYANQSPLDMTPDPPQAMSTPITRNNSPYEEMEPIDEPDYLEDIPEDDDDLPMYDYPRTYW